MSNHIAYDQKKYPKCNNHITRFNFITVKGVLWCSLIHVHIESLCTRLV